MGNGSIVEMAATDADCRWDRMVAVASYGHRVIKIQILKAGSKCGGIGCRNGFLRTVSTETGAPELSRHRGEEIKQMLPNLLVKRFKDQIVKITTLGTKMQIPKS